MRMHWALVTLVLAGGMTLAAGVAAAAETAQGGSQKKIKLLVVAGGHPYQEVKFRAIFANFHDMECTFVEEKKGGRGV
jgi:hypothetical protein